MFQVVKPIIQLLSVLCADKIGKIQFHNEYEDLLKAPNVRYQYLQARSLSLISSTVQPDEQMVPESIPIEFGGTAYTEEEALTVWKAQCTPFMTNKYRV